MTQQLKFSFTRVDRERLSRQCQTVLKALEQGQALTQFNVMTFSEPIMRLAARIEELRRAGYDIKTTMVDTGRGRHASYTMEVRRG